MIIDLREQSGSEIPVDCRVQPDLELEGARLISAVSLVGVVKRGDDRIVLVSTLRGEAECDCARCLKPVSVPLDIAFSDVFVTEAAFAERSEAELSEGDLDVSVFDGDTIDLDESAREQIVLALPEQVFCREDCRGLCPGCGIDLNRSACECELNETDPRWDALKNLK